MSDLRAEALSPIDAATLWPQLHRLATEVIATRSAESLLVSSGLAATGLTLLPRMPRTAVLGLRRGLSYRGVLVARELAGRAGWEVVSIRIAREKDDDAVVALLSAAGFEVARRGGRTLYLRHPESSPHNAAVRRAGFLAYRIERLYAPVAARRNPGPTGFREVQRGDRPGIFRLYCRNVPEHIRRHEAPTLQDWRAVIDSLDCEREWVVDHEGGLVAWVGLGEREGHFILDDSIEGLADAALDLVEANAPRQGTVVLSEFQGDLERRALSRGYLALGVRLVCARRLAVMNPLKEVVAAPAESLAVPH